MNEASKNTFEELLFPIHTNQHEQDIAQSKHILAALLFIPSPLVVWKLATRISETSADKEMTLSFGNAGMICFKTKKTMRKMMTHIPSSRNRNRSVGRLIFGIVCLRYSRLQK